MFDFDVQHPGENTTATLQVPGGFYFIRFFCGKYRAVYTQGMTFKKLTLEELRRQEITLDELTRHT